MSPIAIVSTQLPSMRGPEPTARGSVAGMTVAVEESGGLWLGWDGRISTETEATPRLLRRGPFQLLSVSLSRQEYDDWYLGFANRALWPLLNGRVHDLHLDAEQFAVYRAVNARFAARLAERLSGSERIWVHGHHFFFLAEELRRLGVDLPIGFYLDTPFASPHTLAGLSCSRELVEGLAAFDLIGFRSENDLRSFRTCIAERMGGAVAEDSTASLLGRRFRTDAFPLNVDPRHFAGLAVSEEAVTLSEQLDRYLGDRSGIIGVDPLDRNRDRENRLIAFERSVRDVQGRSRSAFLLQLTTQPTGCIADPVSLKHQLAASPGRHAPLVRYLDRSVGEAALAALYRSSRVGLVLPGHDRMDFLAQQYVAAQCAADPGVLVLSSLTSCAERMTGAIVADPYDVDAVAMAIRRALDMSLEERRDRWSELIVRLRDHDIHRWSRDFIDAISASAQGSRISRGIETGPVRSIRRDAGWRELTGPWSGRTSPVRPEQPIA